MEYDTGADMNRLQLFKIWTFQSIGYKLLTSIKVNRHITKGFRMLPTIFQGLALPNPNIDALSRKIHLIQNKWGLDNVRGKLFESCLSSFPGGSRIIWEHFWLPLDFATHGSFGICGGYWGCVVQNSGYMTHIMTSRSFVKMTEQSWSWSLTQISLMWGTSVD